jgi:oligopeptide/dipeptide ABC transporter ATP-binding protein
MSVLTLCGVTVAYSRRGAPPVRAVVDASLAIAPGEIVGLVGESGCGKSTLGKAAVGLLPLTAGRVSFQGSQLRPLGRGRRDPAFRPLQMVFQDPYSSLNPRRRVGEQIADGIRLGGHGSGRLTAEVAQLLDRVGLPAAARQFPHELSGGQRQRIAVARVLAARPACVVADEPLSALDASAQAQVANLMAALVHETGMAMLFISHDLSVVRQIADRTVVMYLGTIVETGPTPLLWDHPQHPYTTALIAAAPRVSGSAALPAELPGEVPDPARPPGGCRFHPRCPVAEDACRSREPALLPAGPGREVACLVAQRRVAATAGPAVPAAPEGS